MQQCTASLQSSFERKKKGMSFKEFQNEKQHLKRNGTTITESTNTRLDPTTAPSVSMNEHARKLRAKLMQVQA